MSFNDMDWDVSGRIRTIIDGWESSREFPSFRLPWYTAPTEGDARAKVQAILNPYGIFQGSYELYQIGTGTLLTGEFRAARNSDIHPMV